MPRFLRNFVKLRNSFLLVIILVQVLLILMTGMFTSLTIELLEKKEQSDAEEMAAFVNKELHQATSRSLAATAGVINNKEIITAFREHDREKLSAACSKLWSDIKPLGFSQFQFDSTSPDHTRDSVFLRIHDPGKFNDPLSNRPTVLKCFATGKEVSGL